jgi:branched-chain amino acid transport system permease protein
MTFLLHVISLIGMNIPPSLSYSLMLGKQRVMHFGPLAISILAAYGTFIPLLAGLAYPWCLLIGFGLAMIGALFFALLSLRLPEDAFGVFSLAVHLILIAVVLNWTSVTRGALGIPRIARLPFMETPLQFAVAAIVIAGLWFLAMFFLDRSRFGRALQALAEHPAQAAALGINRAKHTIIAFLIASVGLALGSILFAQYLHLLYPTDYGFPALVFILMTVVAGKPGSVPGVTIATILLVILREAVRFVPIAATIKGPFQLILFGIILFVAIWWRKEKLFAVQRNV